MPSHGADLLHNAQNLVTNALSHYATQVRNNGSPNTFDLNTILTPDQMQQLRRRIAVGQIMLAHGDMNHDGVIDIRDLPAVLSRFDGVRQDQLPPGLRTLLHALDTNHNGHMDEQDIDPIVSSMQASPTGTAILQKLRLPSGQGYDPTKVAETFTGLLVLGSESAAPGAHLDLSPVPEDIRPVLLQNLDTDGDGELTPADVADFLATLTRRSPGAPPAPPSPSPRPPPGTTSVGSVTPSATQSTSSAMLPGDGGGSALGPVLCVLLAVIGLALLGGLGYRRWLRQRKRGPTGRMRMIDVPEVVTSSPLDYSAPLPVPAGAANVANAEAGCASTPPAVPGNQ